ncbi:MAG TPA: YlbF family regulator [Spirochaetota bacterium]|nr:YlbF family regulator [Spirochaetota bacterium]HPI90597.1 YlbF family regulator [Spirochaetota bacterium]HPR50101.1 YlbF family regulator [Spirochaetota bacterium]
MEAILEKAREIGMLIRETGIYKRYSETSRALEKDPQSSLLLEKLYSLSRELQERRAYGDIIEDYEERELNETTEEVNSNTIILEYLKAQKEYGDFLIRIQQEIAERDR